MKILLVYPNIDTRNGLHYPHGLGSLAAAAARAGHEPVVRLVQNMPDRAAWSAEVTALDPGLVAFGFGSNQWAAARELMSWTRQTGRPVLAGGVHATFAPAQVLASGACDWLCVGEGEGALLELAAGKEPRRIANLRGEGFANPPRPLVDELDELPVYDRRHFPMAEIGRINGGEMTVLAGRGCPFQCAYCANPAWRKLYAGGNWVRWRSIDHLFAELDLLLRLYPVESFYFEDDIFTLNRDFLEEFIAEYPRRFDRPFRCYLRIGTVDFADLRRLRDAGLLLANVGVEHGDPALRENVLRRRMSNAQIETFFAWCRELDIRTRAFHIVGIPGETPRTLQATIDLIERTTPDEIQVSLFEPFPGTELHDLCAANGWLRTVARPSYFAAEAAVSLPDFSPDALAAAYRACCARLPEIEERAFTRRLAAEPAGDLDLLAAWSPECVVEQGAEPVARRLTRIGRDRRPALFAHPRATVAFSVPLGAWRFQTAIAFESVCLGWGGGGARFVVALDGRRIAECWLDPKHLPSDRGWHEVEVSFTLAEAGRLELITLPGDDGDLTGLWTVWGRPRLVRRDAP